MRSTLSPSAGLDLPSAIANARSAASGLENTYVDERNTAGRADPTESRGSKPRVSTAVGGRTKYGILSLAMVKPLISNLPRLRRAGTSGKQREGGKDSRQRFWGGPASAAQLGSQTRNTAARARRQDPLRRSRAHSASWIALTRPWHQQITIAPRRP